ncbi:MAG: hypothetical protein WA294_02510 [Acidobacteriaceae bacterium]
MSENPLEQIAERTMAAADWQAAIGRLGKATEPASFWLDIVKDETYSAGHRARALCLLFRRHVPVPVKVGDLAALLGRPGWLHAGTVQAVKHLKGEIPVEWNPGETVLAVRLDAARSEAGPVLYLRLSGSVGVRAFLHAMQGTAGGRGAADARVLEAGCSFL